MAGMMVFAGVCELLFSFIVKKVRIIYPKEICGLAFLIVGAQVAIIAFNNSFHSPKLISILYLVIMLSIIIGFSVWGRGIWKNLGSLYAVIIGIIIYNFFPLLQQDDGAQITNYVQEIAFIDLPHLPNFWSTGFQFDISLIPIFLLTAFTATIRVIGVALIANTYETGKSRPNYNTYQKAIRADAISSILSSCLTGLAINVSPVTATLTIGAKCTSRLIAIGVMIVYLLISFSPYLISFLAQMPNLLISSMLIWYANLLIVSGLQVMQPHKFQIKEYYIVGLPIIFVITMLVSPDIYHNLPHYLTTITDNALAPGLLLAILLTLVFYIKSYKESGFTFYGHRFNKKILRKKIQAITDNAIDTETLNYISSSVSHMLDIINYNMKDQGTIDIKIHASKLNLEITLYYKGKLLQFQKFDKEIIFNLVEDEAVYIGLKGLDHSFAQKVIEPTFLMPLF